jgi:hypothetical protein
MSILTLFLVRSVLPVPSIEQKLTGSGCAVDQPAGTGLSYASTDRYLTELTDVRTLVAPIETPPG